MMICVKSIFGLLLRSCTPVASPEMTWGSQARSELFPRRRLEVTGGEFRDSEKESSVLTTYWSESNLSS